MILDFFRISVESPILVLKDYLDFSENNLSKALETEKQRIDDEIKKASDEKTLEILRYTTQPEYEYIYQTMFPRTLRYSFINLLLSEVERFVKAITKRVKETKALPIEFKFSFREKGDLFDQAKKYLETSANMSPIDPIIWTNMKELSTVRISIVHYSGEVTARYRDIIEKVASNKIGLSIGEAGIGNGFIIIEKSYCETMLQQVEEFIQQILSQV